MENILLISVLLDVEGARRVLMLTYSEIKRLPTCNIT